MNLTNLCFSQNIDLHNVLYICGKKTYLTASWIQSQMEASKLGLFKARGIKRAGLHKSSLQLTCKQRKGLRQWLDVKSRLCDWPRLAAVEWTFRRLCSIDLLLYVSIWHSEANGDNFSLFILGFESRETVCHCPRNKVEVEEAHFLLFFFDLLQRHETIWSQQSEVDLSFTSFLSERTLNTP